MNNRQKFFLILLVVAILGFIIVTASPYLVFPCLKDTTPCVLNDREKGSLVGFQVLIGIMASITFLAAIMVGNSSQLQGFQNGMHDGMQNMQNGMHDGMQNMRNGMQNGFQSMRNGTQNGMNRMRNWMRSRRGISPQTCQIPYEEGVQNDNGPSFSSI